MPSKTGTGLFLAMELVGRKTLTELIPRQGMSLDQLLQVGIPLADAVGAAHQRGITHRDLKPANVMVTDEGRVKVLDSAWRSCTRSRPSTASRSRCQAPVTGDGRIVGTVAYMSPEQAQGKPVDARSDVFSLGILLFEMATGESRSRATRTCRVLSAIIKDTPSSVTELRQDLPRDVGRSPALPGQGSGRPLSDGQGTAQRPAAAQGGSRHRRGDDAQPSSHISQAAVAAPPVPLLAGPRHVWRWRPWQCWPSPAVSWYARRPAAAGRRRLRPSPCAASRTRGRRASPPSLLMADTSCTRTAILTSRACGCGKSRRPAACRSCRR